MLGCSYLDIIPIRSPYCCFLFVCLFGWLFLQLVQTTTFLDLGLFLPEYHTHQFPCCFICLFVFLHIEQTTSTTFLDVGLFLNLNIIPIRFPIVFCLFVCFLHLVKTIPFLDVGLFLPEYHPSYPRLLFFVCFTPSTVHT